MAIETSDGRFVRLEEKAAYLEKSSRDLEEMVIRQGQLIDELQKRLDRLERQVQASTEGGEFPHEKPPHY